MQKLHSGSSAHVRRVPAAPIFFSVALLLFVGIALAVILGSDLTEVDLSVAAWFHRRATTFLADGMAAISFLGAPTSLALVAVAGSIMLFTRHRRVESAALSIVVLGGDVLNIALKHLFERGRPVLDDPLFTLPTYSFPSGHAMASTVFYGLLAIHMWQSRATRPWASVAIGAATLMVALVCLSRVYLGLHYLSDVLGGVAEGVTWLALSSIVLHRIRRDGAYANVSR